MNALRIALFLLLFLVRGVPLMAQGTYTQIDYPGAIESTAWGIDSVGNISGYYFDANGVPHGYLSTQGVFTSVDYPGAKDTYLFGLNDQGQVVGFSDDLNVGFVYESRTHKFTIIQFPGAVTTIPTVINGSHMVGGYFGDVTGTAYGFEFTGSVYRRIAPNNSHGTFVTGIDALGTLVCYGLSIGTSKPFNFAIDHLTYRSLPLQGVPNAQVGGVSPAGTAVVGSYDPPPGFQAGFVYQNGTLTTLQFPGGNNTYAAAINDGAGDVVGTFVENGGGLAHGFLWTPPADAPKP